MEHRHRRRSGLRRAGSTAVTAAGAMILVVGLSQLGTASPGTGTAQGTTAAAARPMENLGRGVVAVRSGESDVLVSWRLLGLDPENIGFNVYRATCDGDWSQINDDVLTDGTNFVDSGADLSQSNSYRVTPVVDGEEGEPWSPPGKTSRAPTALPSSGPSRSAASCARCRSSRTAPYAR